MNTANMSPVFHHPDGARLGLFTAIQNIGGVCALFFCESMKYRRFPAPADSLSQPRMRPTFLVDDGVWRSD
jgi:hypothetical protein